MIRLNIRRQKIVLKTFSIGKVWLNTSFRCIFGCKIWFCDHLTLIRAFCGLNFSFFGFWWLLVNIHHFIFSPFQPCWCPWLPPNYIYYFKFLCRIKNWCQITHSLCLSLPKSGLSTDFWLFLRIFSIKKTFPKFLSIRFYGRNYFSPL